MKIKILLFVFGVILGAAPMLAIGAAGCSGTATGIDLSGCSPVGLSIVNILCGIANFIFELALAAAVIAFLVAAFYYLTAYGNEQQITKAKGTFLYVVYGIAVAILAWGATFIIASLLSGGAVNPALDPCP